MKHAGNADRDTKASASKRKYAKDDWANRAMFENYQELEGKHTFRSFVKNLDKFFEFTLDAYTGGEYHEGGPQSREEAYGLWIKYIGSAKEAGRYFDAVDNFSAYS